MRARLLLAFVAIAGFAVLAAAAGIYAFREVGARLDIVDARMSPTLAALELSRSAERIIAAAPALLVATEPARRSEVNAGIAAELARLQAKLRELKGGGARPPGRDIEANVSALVANLAALDALVGRRLDMSERTGALRRAVFQAEDETQRLLAPWLDVTESQIAALVDAGEGERSGIILAPLIATQQLLRNLQAGVSRVVDLLSQASTTDEPRRLHVLRFQVGASLRDLETAAAGLDARLRALVLEQIGKLRELGEGPNSIIDLRQQDVALLAEGQELLGKTGSLSAQLTAAVDRLGSVAKQDIGEAIGDALSVQQLSTRILVVVVALSLVTSVLIVWRYVGRNIVRRLAALSDSMLALAGGRLDVPVRVEGTDEISAMARALEVFRRNILERDGFAIASKVKSRLIASASHDLRQPLHALNLFVAQLRTEPDAAERARLLDRVDAAVSSMNELFDALLDLSKLEAGVLEPSLSEFPLQPLLTRMEASFAGVGGEKGLRLRVLPSHAWVRSDPILLERIVLNLVSNAVRYTRQGGVVVGCRIRGDACRIDVCDTGPGIPEAQQRVIFGEFVQLAAGNSARGGGLGLGLSIVDRLGRLLGHPIEVQSRLGSGSRFSVVVPRAAAQTDLREAAVPSVTVLDPARGKLIVVVDDDPLVLDGMGGILRSWGCRVVAAASAESALAELRAQRLDPDLIISDLRLADGKTGLEAIEILRRELGAAIPAFLISGDTAPERAREARASGYHLLHKPVAPMRLRAMLNQLLKRSEAPVETGPAARRRPRRHRAVAEGAAPRPR